VQGDVATGHHQTELVSVLVAGPSRQEADERHTSRLHSGIRSFFYDILIFNDSWSSHLQHVCAILERMRAHNLSVKKSKCSFGEHSVAYLGHVISAQGVAMCTDKVKAEHAWPQPCTVRVVRGFLGLTGYYQKFIRLYGDIATPLTQLLKCDAFHWTSVANTTFEALKVALTTTPVLQLPDFTRAFIVDCDASGSGMGAILHQGEGPLAFFSRAMQPHHAKLVVYERELIDLVKVVCHWRPYLWTRSSVRITSASSIYSISACQQFHNTLG
jgi:hypothetical protein